MKKALNELNRNMEIIERKLEDLDLEWTKVNSEIKAYESLEDSEFDEVEEAYGVACERSNQISEKVETLEMMKEQTMKAIEALETMLNNL